jgi:hypothetical protein
MGPCIRESPREPHRFEHLRDSPLAAAAAGLPQVQAPDGNFYGTLSGDIHHPGWVYQLSPTGAFRIVATFNGKNGTQPDQLALGAGGALYGTTESGGTTGGGVPFKLTLPR